jgi:hypothetical protein
MDGIFTFSIGKMRKKEKAGNKAENFYAVNGLGYAKVQEFAIGVSRQDFTDDTSLQGLPFLFLSCN